MPNEHMKFMPAAHLMNAKEIFEIASIFVSQGITKIRLTGGEPLVRKDFKEIIESLSSLPVELTLTSNGVLIDDYLETLIKANVHSINISLDTLNRDKFNRITQRNLFDRVYKNILLLVENNFHVKLNSVLMKGNNEDEINSFILLGKDLPIHIRFIEFMPFTGNHWDKSQVITQQEILKQIGSVYSFIKLEDAKHDTAKKYKIDGFKGSFAIITTMSEPFCSDCNRVRLTADGKLKNCLFSAEESDLLTSFRAGKDILPIIKQSILGKKQSQGGQFAPSFEETDPEKLVNRSMINIGG